MSRQLLINLNGNKTGQLKKFLDDFKGEPRIAWYPSAGEDFRALLYLHPNFSRLHPPARQEPQPPDLFLFTDYSPWGGVSFSNNETIYSDRKTKVFVESVEELPRLNLPLHDGIVCFPGHRSFTDRAVFLKIKIESDRLGIFTYPLLYAFAENEAFYCEKLIPNKATITHIIHVRYGGGLGGGGRASGAWLLNVLEKLNCELFITDNHHHWQSGDTRAMELCPFIPKRCFSMLTPIRTIQSKKWSGHGDVTWYIVRNLNPPPSQNRTYSPYKQF